ncbi:MAG: biopolymer transporter ExbD [Kiritimatiellales bacterium]
MKRSECEAVLYLHRTFRPRRRTGRGFLTGTVFLDAALLTVAFLLATSPFVLKPGIELELPDAASVGGIRYNDTVLSISSAGLFFFNDELVAPDNLEAVLTAAVQNSAGAALILEADRAVPQSTAAAVYDAAARAGFKRILIATQNTAR